MEQTINGNINTCIQYSNSIGGTTYYDICRDTQHWVPWGSGDWIGAIAGTLLVVGLVGLLGFFGYCMWRG